MDRIERTLESANDSVKAGNGKSSMDKAEKELTSGDIMQLKVLQKMEIKCSLTLLLQE